MAAAVVCQLVELFKLLILNHYLFYVELLAGVCVPGAINKAIPLKCFVSHRPPSREGGSVGGAKKRKRTHEVSEGQ